jgi:ABC-type sugar transport system permease subunit
MKSGSNALTGVGSNAKSKSIKSVLKKNIGFAFILLWIIGFLVFRLYPFLSSLFYSFTNFNLFTGISEYGISNYKEIFSDKKIMESLGITFTYAFITVPLKLIFALFIAYILNFRIRGVNLFRTAYYIPSILGGSVAIAVLWKALFRDRPGAYKRSFEFDRGRRPELAFGFKICFVCHFAFKGMAIWFCNGAVPCSA